jgi:hypothetical protein
MRATVSFAVGTLIMLALWSGPHEPWDSIVTYMTVIVGLGFVTSFISTRLWWIGSPGILVGQLVPLLIEPGSLWPLGVGFAISFAGIAVCAAWAAHEMWKRYRKQSATTSSA